MDQIGDIPDPDAGDAGPECTVGDKDRIWKIPNPGGIRNTGLRRLKLSDLRKVWVQEVQGAVGVGDGGPGKCGGHRTEKVRVIHAGSMFG